MRVTLEAEAMRLSVPQMTSEDLARLEGHMAEMAHYAQAEGLPALDRSRTASSTARSPRRAGERVNFVLGQMFDHAERYRRLHIGHGPSAWATAGTATSSTPARPATATAAPACWPAIWPAPDSRCPSCSSPGYDPAASEDRRRRCGRRTTQETVASRGPLMADERTQVAIVGGGPGRTAARPPAAPPRRR